MIIATSYFYQIRNFKQNMIPISTCISDPFWFKPPNNKEYFFDKNGVINGLRYEPLIVQPLGPPEQYRELLDTVDFDKMIKGFQFCANKFKIENPIIVLMVYEKPDNPFSERSALQDYFTCHGWECKELKYPIAED